MSSKEMKPEFQNMLLKSVDEAVEHARDKKKKGFRITRVEVAPIMDTIDPQVIRKLREKLKITQVLFADIFGVAESTIQNWEAGNTSPPGPSKRLLGLFLEDMEVARNLLVEQTYSVIPEKKNKRA